MKRTRLAYPYIFVWMPLFIVAPMLFVAYYAFFDNGTFTTEYVKQVFSSTTYLPALWNSILLSILFIMPMWMNMLLRTLAWKIILYDDGIVATVLSWFGATDVQLIYTPGAVLIATIYDFLPFMILPIYTTLIKIDRSHIEAAHDLGANGLNTFLRVVLPQSIPGIISGITMVFVPAMSTFAVSTMLGGKKIVLFGQLIEEKFLINKSFGVGSTLSLVLIILVIISMVIMRRADRDEGREGGTLW